MVLLLIRELSTKVQISWMLVNIGNRRTFNTEEKQFFIDQRSRLKLHKVCISDIISKSSIENGVNNDCKGCLGLVEVLHLCALYKVVCIFQTVNYTD